MSFRNQYLRNATLTALALPFILIIGMHEASAQQSGTNIILIMADDLGYECIEANGGTSYHTPNLNKLAESGMRFEHCHAQPICTPSRVQIMTGIYNNRNYLEFGKLDRTQTSFAHLFRDAGYKTCIAGKWQLGKELDSPDHFGFDEYCLWQHTRGRVDTGKHDTRFSNPLLQINGELVRYTNGEYGPDIVSDYLCDFIARNKDNPFLAYYPMILTHCPFTPTPDSEDWDPGDMGSLDYKGDTAYFGDMVMYMDKMVGKIISELEENGLRENTLVLFTGDNGTDQPVVSVLDGKEIPGGKGLTSDNGTHVPLIASWSGSIKKSQVCSDLVDFSDFLPSICHAAGIKVPGDLEVDGRSFLPQLHGKKGKPREWIYGWYSPRGEVPRIWARNKKHKLYSSGELYDVENDFLEESPVNIQQIGKKEKREYRGLEKVISQQQNMVEK